MGDPTPQPGHEIGTPVEHHVDIETLFRDAADSDELNNQIREALKALPPAGNVTAIIARIGHLLRRTLPDEEPSLHNALTESPAQLSVADAHQLAILVQSPPGTDFAVLSITQETACAHLQLWRSVVNHAPAYTTEVPLYIAGMAAWAGGYGPVATIAFWRSQVTALGMAGFGIDPASHLHHDLIDEVATPARWDQMRLALLADADPRVRHEISTGGRHPPAHHTDRPDSGRQQPDPGPERRPSCRARPHALWPNFLRLLLKAREPPYHLRKQPRP